jgi:plasmid stabilization system protein ParE
MPYRIVIADSAKTDTESIHRWVTEQAPLRGSEWFEKLLDCLYSLAENPGRCPLAPEARRQAAISATFSTEDEGTPTAFSLRLMKGGKLRSFGWRSRNSLASIRIDGCDKTLRLVVGRRVHELQEVLDRTRPRMH